MGWILREERVRVGCGVDPEGGKSMLFSAVKVNASLPC